MAFQRASRHLSRPYRAFSDLIQISAAIPASQRTRCTVNCSFRDFSGHGGITSHARGASVVIFRVFAGASAFYRFIRHFTRGELG